MRFFGSKALLLQNIENVIKENVDSANTFCDIFSGTSIVSRYFKKYFQIYSNDLLYFSYVLQRATIKINKTPKFEKLKLFLNNIEPFEYLENTDINNYSFKKSPFIYENYSPNEKSERKYFTNENALRIDFIRQTIEEWRNNNLINENEYFYLLAGVIEGVPYVSNIAGNYSAFLKHWDKRVFKKFKMIKLNIEDNYKENKCFNKDSNILIREISVDILYVDPPYNQRQYAPNYHILETIARYDYPKIKGKTGLRPYEDTKSQYCIKSKVLNVFEDLIENANFKHIIVSYSTEGFMSIKEIENILKKYGDKKTYKLYKIPYRRYKNKPGLLKHNLYELIFYIKKG